MTAIHSCGVGFRHCSLSVMMALLYLTRQTAGSVGASEPSPILSPTALAATMDGKIVYVACATANRVVSVNLGTRRVTLCVETPGAPSGLILGANDAKLFVTCAAPESKVAIVDLAERQIVAQIPTGHTSMAPVLSLDGKTLYVCNRFSGDVSVIDLISGRERERVQVQREPTAAALTPDGRLLLVANFLPVGPANARTVAAVVSVIDIAAGAVVKEIQLPDGSGSLNDLRISPDGNYAIVTHIRSRYRLPATLLERGWMNTNAKTIIDVANLTVLNTVLLDDLREGAANPWGAAWSAQGSQLVIAHAGLHELSIIDFPKVLAKLRALPAAAEEQSRPADYGPGARTQSEVPDDLAFLGGLKARLKLPEGDRGPRAILAVGNRMITANYYSDTLSIVDLDRLPLRPETIPLGPKPQVDLARMGEEWFHDATICHQHWQSCSSCHPSDARSDALNWDLPNDGIRTPKNTKSLLLAHATPPAMSLGVRETAPTAVRAGIKHILFAQLPESIPAAIDEYLRSLHATPSPHLRRGCLSAAAERGSHVFQSAGCAKCHRPGLLTDLHSYDVGTRGRFDRAEEKFDTPTLTELWRTAPYLHDGSAATVLEVITTRNLQDRHGRTSGMGKQDLDDLCSYLLSL